MTPLSASAPDERDKVSAIAPIPRISMVPPSVSVCIPQGQRTRLVSDAQIKPKRRPNCHQESVQLRNRTRAQKVPARNRSALRQSALPSILPKSFAASDSITVPARLQVAPGRCHLTRPKTGYLAPTTEALRQTTRGGGGPKSRCQTLP